MNERISRRQILAAAGGIGAALGSNSLVGSALGESPAPAKQMNKQDVQYQDQPKGEQRCSTCTNFAAPSGCRVVAGTVSPNGWCMLYKAKAA